jgi:hypothetical protein
MQAYHSINVLSMRKVTSIIASVLIGTTSIIMSSTSASGEGWQPAPVPNEYPSSSGQQVTRRWDEYTAVCSTEIQLDCFESVAAFLNGAWVSGTPTNRAREYRIDGLVNEDGLGLVEFTHGINYTGNVFHQVNVFPSTYTSGSRKPWESGETTCDNPTNGVCYREGHLQRGVKFRVTYRSSWVLPTAMSAKLTETKTVVEKLSVSGATRVTVEGIPEYFMGVQNDATLTDLNGRGSWGIEHFAISMTDGRRFPFKSECIDKPTLTVSDNGYGHPIPTFENNELKLKTSAPHFRPDGVNKHIGYYNAVIPLETAQCLWGESVTNPTQFAVDVFETSTGVAKSSQSLISLDNGAINIRTTGFTYSTPTVRVRFNATASIGGKVPAKPKSVKTRITKNSVTTSFTRVSGVKYTAVAVNKGTRKTLKCKTAKNSVTCTATGLKKGTWRLTITPAIKQVAGKSYVTTVRVR